ncbi:hypothetical protein NDU88_006559 [Pleurodeles waltl]|uniref:Uncharacterized protein n=1 Tax=Pleurodeles waltl TaxID=8319 RepID=A0AAV7TY56_PLEWA|nr:hypothetical protein NDU88_006559 [Pleurodeles waltl]
MRRVPLGVPVALDFPFGDLKKIPKECKRVSSRTCAGSLDFGPSEVKEPSDRSVHQLPEVRHQNRRPLCMDGFLLNEGLPLCIGAPGGLGPHHPDFEAADPSHLLLAVHRRQPRKVQTAEEGSAELYPFSCRGLAAGQWAG